MSYAWPPRSDDRDDWLIAGVMTRRCLAWVVDLLLIGLIVGVLWCVLLLFGLLTFGLGFGADGRAAGRAVLLPFPVPVAVIQRHAGAGAVRPDGAARTRISARRRGLQALIFTLVFYLTLATSGLLLLVALFTVRHRTLHDLRQRTGAWCARPRDGR